MSLRYPVLLFCLVPLPALGADPAHVEALVTAYVTAFNERQVDAVAAMWAEDCRHLERDTGERTEGGAAMRAALEAALTSDNPPRLSAEVQSVQAITDDVLRIEGTTTTVLAGVDPSVSAFTAVLKRQGDGWLIASMDEGAVPQPATPAEALAPLDWFVGTWVDRSDADVPVVSSVRWSPSRTFLIRSFAADEAGESVPLGTQVIGWDPRGQQIRSWTFNADGSFGDGVWTASDGDWLIRSTETQADGGAASGTYVLKRTGDDSVELKLVGLEIDGEPEPTPPAVVATRVSAEATPSESAEGGE